ncbi:MAG TPA: M50 family metallopeptidase [Actinomycetota bacterium]
MNGLLFVVLILVAIGLHEFGHFITAKKFGMKVDRFFIGFGPPIWSVKRGETEYGFAWIPAGGYVRIAGMNPFEEVPDEDKHRVFKAKKPWQRAIVLAAGSTMHFLIAFVMLAALLMTAGIKDGDATRTVYEVEPGTPAAAAGFRTGDTVLAVDGAGVTSWEEARNIIRSKPGETISFTVERDGAEKTLRATLRSANPDGLAVGFLGVAPDIESVRRGPLTAVGQSAKFVPIFAWESLKNLGRIVSPSTFAHMFQVLLGNEERKIDDPASIVGVTRAAGSSSIVNLLFLFIGFNIFIGVANLLPLPPLDGGHLAVLTYEKIRKRDVDMRKLIPVSATVIAVFLGLFVLSLAMDIVAPLPALPN